jgi:hypothetical protein
VRSVPQPDLKVKPTPQQIRDAQWEEYYQNETLYTWDGDKKVPVMRSYEPDECSSCWFNS